MLLPALQVDVVSGNEDFLSELKNVGSVSAGVASVGEAAAYALVWEFGNVRQHQKGPKTTLGINLLTGEQVWLTIQAPSGYIRVNESAYWEIVGKHIGSLTLSGTTTEEIRKEIEQAAYAAAKEIAELIRETAPIGDGPGAGALRASILAIPPGDEMLNESNDDFELFENQVLDLDTTENDET